MKTFLLILVVFVCCFGANHYVRDGAAGTGSGDDWTNAYDSLPATLVRGDTYYFADGTYPPYNFDDAESGALLIRIQKATDSDHGTETGWNSTYGDGVAEWTRDAYEDLAVITLSTGYYFFDGVTGSDSTGYGFKVSNGSHAFESAYAGASETNNTTIQYFDMEGPGWKTCTGGDRGLNLGADADSLIIRHNYIHDYSTELVNVTGITKSTFLEHNLLKRSGTNCVPQHSVAVWFWCGSLNMDLHIRYNNFVDMTNVGGTGYISLGYNLLSPSESDSVFIYGNIFQESNDVEVGPSRLVGVNGDPGMSGVKFYHNTIYNIHNNGANLNFQCASCTGIDVQNNLWIDGDNTPVFLDIGEIDTLHNIYNTLTKSIFTDADNGNFVPDTSINIGCADLGDRYNTDASGIVRGSSGIIAPGAYAYNPGYGRKIMIWATPE